MVLADSERRFGGLVRLYGVDGAQDICAAHVLIVGIGGVGSWAAEALARSGVGCLTLVDMDHVAESNINRQIQAVDTTLGMAKIEAMRERIASYSPNCRVYGVDDFVTPENWTAIFQSANEQQTVDAVIDACDQVKTKTILAAWARHAEVRKSCSFVAVGAAGGKRRAEKVEIADLSDTTHDPLLAQVRYRLRREHGASKGKKLGVQCVFSREAVASPAQAVCGTEQLSPSFMAGQALNCAGYGSMVSVTATFGMVAAGHIVDQLAASNVSK